MCFLFTIKHPLIWCLWTHTWDTWSHIRLTLKYQSQWYVFSRRTNKLVNDNCLTFHILSHYKTHHGYLMCLYWCMKHQWLWCYMPPACLLQDIFVLCFENEPKFNYCCHRLNKFVNENLAIFNLSFRPRVLWFHYKT